MNSARSIDIYMSKGHRGKQGKAGPPGVQGIPGLNGPQGSRGLTGATGAQGPAGRIGATGPQGRTGPQGLPGPSGKDGAVGHTGIAGPIGPIGATGAHGPIGATGVQGPTGPPGPAGPGGPMDPVMERIIKNVLTQPSNSCKAPNGLCINDLNPAQGNTMMCIGGDRLCGVRWTPVNGQPAKTCTESLKAYASKYIVCQDNYKPSASYLEQQDLKACIFKCVPK